MPTITTDVVDVLVRRISYSSLHLLCDEAHEVDNSDVAEHISAVARAEVQRRVIVKLRPFLALGSVEEFLVALRDFNAVLAGSSVVELLDPMAMERSSTLDIIVTPTHYWRFYEHLVDVQGCTNIRRIHHIPGLSPSGYEHADELTSMRGVFRLICSPAPTPLFTIPYFYSTHLMNYLSYDHLCVAYPQLTFARQGIEVFPAATSTTFTIGTRESFFPDLDACIPREICGGHDRLFDDEFCAITNFREGYTTHGTVVWKLGGEKCSPLCSSLFRVVFDL